MSCWYIQDDFFKLTHPILQFNKTFIQVLIFRIFKYSLRPYFKILYFFCTYEVLMECPVVIQTPIFPTNPPLFLPSIIWGMIFLKMLMYRINHLAITIDIILSLVHKVIKLKNYWFEF